MLRERAGRACHPRGNRSGEAVLSLHAGRRTAVRELHRDRWCAGTWPRELCAGEPFNFDTSWRRDRARDDLLLRRGRPFRRDVCEEIAQDALVGMYRRTAGPRVILDVFVQPLRNAGRHELRLANHGERRRSHVDDRENREQRAAKPGEPMHG